MATQNRSSFVATMAAQYGKRLRRFLSSRSRNAADVPDLAQEVFLRLLRVDHHDAIRSPEAYLFTVASHYSTDIGEQRQITLEDGSTVLLNARSRLRVHFSEDARHLDLLAGQALFDVAKDSVRPFTVRSQGVLIRAVGTEFDVYRRRSGTTVSVVEGKVSVIPEPVQESRAVSPEVAAPMRSSAHSTQGAATYLSAGEQVVIVSGTVQRPTQALTSTVTAWTQRRWVFDGATLTDVADEFNRYNRRELVVHGESAQHFHVSGVYSSTDPASLIRFLKAQPGLHVVETDSEIRVRSQ